MRKAAATRETTTKTAGQDEIQQFLEAEAIKSQFWGATLNMSFRLFFSVVLPIVAGVKIDEHFKIAPICTLLGIVVASVAGCVAVWGIVKEVTRKQAADDRKFKKIKGRVKRA